MAIVAIFGVDGCGKTTQAMMLVDSLKKNGHDAVYVKPVFLLLAFLANHEHEVFLSVASPRTARTSVVAKGEQDRVSPRGALAGILGYLYALATYFFIACRLSRGRIVVCDRYFFQFFFDLYGKSAHKVVDVFPKPDIAFFLDAEIDSLYSRMSDPSDSSTSRVYFVDVHRMLEGICKKYGFARINAGQSAERIGEALLKKVVDVTEGT